MAILSFYRAVDSQNDGSKGDQIVSGEANALLPYLTSQDRINGVTQMEKLYIQSDTQLSVFIGITSEGLFDAAIIDSDSTTEVAADVDSTRPRFGAAKITANTANDVTIETPSREFFRADDYILVGDIVVQMDAVTDNGDGTTKITYKYEVPYVDLVGSNAASVIKADLDASVAKPIWVENVVPAGAPASSTSNTIPLIIVS